MKASRFLFAALLATFAASSTPAQDPPDAHFRIELHVDAAGVSMRCTKGCVWETLSVSCSANEPCGFVLDQNGMGQ